MARKNNDERPADLLFWPKDGSCFSYKARVAADVEISIGRTDSKRALGFVVTNRGKRESIFVLNRDQCAELARFLQILPGLRKPLGRKPKQISLLSQLAMTVAKRRRR